MKKNDLIIVIIFIGFLFIPNISYWFLKDKMDKTDYENRNLYTKPEFTFKNIKDFPKNYENYFNDNLAYKNEIRKIRSQINYNIFNISSNDRVILGKKRWLFYNSDIINDGTSINDYRKTSFYTNEQISKIKDDLLKTRDLLKDNNTEFYVLIAPNKENVYSDYMPKLITRSNEKNSRTEELIDYLKKETDLNIIYPKKTLVDNRNKYETYYKYDTHWNEYGAYLGTMELIQNIDKDFKKVNIKIENEKNSGDLASMNLMSNKLVNSEPIVKGFYDNIKYTCDSDIEFKICTSNESVYDKTILVVGDSFRNNMLQYIAKLYKNSIFIHKSYYKDNYIKKYKPDIVVYEAVERFSITLNNASVLIK